MPEQMFGERLARIEEKQDSMREDISSIKATVESHYVTKADFGPVQKIVYGMVGVILTGFIVIVTSLVFQK